VPGCSSKVMKEVECEVVAGVLINTFQKKNQRDVAY
jgi:hypothetical protein